MAVRRVGRALRALHGTPAEGTVPAQTGVGERDAQAEALSTLSAGTYIATLLPGVGSAYSSLLCEAVATLDNLPTERLVLAHGDFKGDNVLVHQGHPSILDLDRACRGEPALDLGKFLADLAWWCPHPAELAVLKAAFRAGYGVCDPLRWARAEMWAVLFDLKIAARRCALHHATWEAEVRSRVEAAGAALSVARGA
jgi:aminoglycoside phosphotransferase (APT) family kinase protein